MLDLREPVYDQTQPFDRCPSRVRRCFSGVSSHTLCWAWATRVLPRRSGPGWADQARLANPRDPDGVTFTLCVYARNSPRRARGERRVRGNNRSEAAQCMISERLISMNHPTHASQEKVQNELTRRSFIKGG